MEVNWKPGLRRRAANSQRQHMHIIDPQLIHTGQLSPCPSWSEEHTHTHTNIQRQTMLLRAVSSHIARSWIMNVMKADFEIASFWNQQPPLPIPPHQEKSHNPPWAMPSLRDGPHPAALDTTTKHLCIWHLMHWNLPQEDMSQQSIPSNQTNVLALVLGLGGCLPFQSSC